LADALAIHPHRALLDADLLTGRADGAPQHPSLGVQRVLHEDDVSPPDAHRDDPDQLTVAQGPRHLVAADAPHRQNGGEGQQQQQRCEADQQQAQALHFPGVRVIGPLYRVPLVIVSCR